MNARSSAPLVARQPQYVLVAQRLIDDITSGRYPLGKLLPTELDLCTQFAVSRHTIREAIRLLSERGLVTRRRGIGTSVKANRVGSRYVQSSLEISDLPRYVENTRLVTSKAEDIIVDASLVDVLKCHPGQRWIKVTGFRYAGRDKLPIALTEIYITAAYAGIRELIGTIKVPVYTLIERQYGITIVEVQQEIRATIIGAVDAKRLGVKSGAAGLLITRRYLGENERPIEISVSLHPAERFSYSMSMRLQSPSDTDM